MLFRPRMSAGLLALAVASLLSTAALAAAAPVTIRISNFAFDAPSISVAVGTTVTWVNEDDDPHTVVSDDKSSFRSKPLDTHERFSFTFTRAGAFGYFCSIHPHMTGKVVVKAP